MSRALSNPMKLDYQRVAKAHAGQPPMVAFLTRSWLICVCIALLGYALMGRGFAYIGLPPLFAAEFLAAAGIACLLVCGRWWVILRMPQMIALMTLFGWCSLRTIPFF